MARILYLLAFVVSFVGLNIHYGITLYLSRLMMIIFIFVILIRLSQGKKIKLHKRVAGSYVKMMSMIILAQLISILSSGLDNIPYGLRELVITLSAMFLFVTVLLIADDLEKIVNAVRLYILAAAVQGLYGLYQITLAPLGWPTYQTMLAGIPTANDRTEGGLLFFSAYETFRASGFFPADPSHYAAYLTGAIILIVSYQFSTKRSWYLMMTLVICTFALFLSFSRSGILALFVFGLPLLAYLLSRANRDSHYNFYKLAERSLRIIVLSVIAIILLQWADPEFQVTEKVATIFIRIGDLTNPGDSGVESMSTHIETRLLALDAFLSNPAIGVGMGLTISPWYSETYKVFWYGAHSHHLDILGETGLIGAILQWLLMGMAIRHMWQGLIVGNTPSFERNLLAGLLAAYVTIILGNFLYRFYLNDFVWFIMGLGVALSRLLIIQARPNTLIESMH